MAACNKLVADLSGVLGRATLPPEVLAGTAALSAAACPATWPACSNSRLRRRACWRASCQRCAGARSWSWRRSRWRTCWLPCCRRLSEPPWLKATQVWQGCCSGGCAGRIHARMLLLACQAASQPHRHCRRPTGPTAQLSAEAPWPRQQQQLSAVELATCLSHASS